MKNAPGELKAAIALMSSQKSSPCASAAFYCIHLGCIKAKFWRRKGIKSERPAVGIGTRLPAAVGSR